MIPSIHKPDPRKENIVDILDEWLASKLERVHTCLPGKIESYEGHDERKATVKPLVKLRTVQGSILEIPPIENVPVNTIYLVLMCMIGLTVVMLMRVVGLIMVIAMLTMPSAIAGQFVKDMKKMMSLASILGMAFTTAGLWLSYFLNLTSGATIILVSATVYLVSLGLKPLIRRQRLMSARDTVC